MSSNDGGALGKRNVKRERRKERERRVDWIDGYSLRLSRDEKKDIKAELEQEDIDMMSILRQLSDVGIKTSLGYDRKADAYSVTLYRNHPEYADAGYSLTARAKTYERCMAGLLYALREVNDFNIVQIAEERQQEESDF